MIETNPTVRKYTLIGCIAPFLWASVLPLIRRVSEDLGPLTTAAVTYFLSSLLGFVYFSAAGKLKNLEYFQNKEFYYRAFFFVCNITLIYWAIGSVERAGMPLAILLNYLWPTITMLLSVWLLKQKCRPFILAVGSAIVVFGLSVEIIGPHYIEVFGAVHKNKNLLPYLAAFVGGAVWGVQSVLNRTWGTRAGGFNSLPFFMLFVSIVLFVMRFASKEQSTFTTGAILPLIYLSLVPILANICWDLGTRLGNITLLSLVADAMPWGSLTVTALYLKVPIELTTWVSAIIIVFGAVVSRFSLLSVEKNRSSVRNLNEQSAFCEKSSDG